MTWGVGLCGLPANALVLFTEAISRMTTKVRNLSCFYEFFGAAGKALPVL